jgi:diguanylate cyclase (GGDEF)-like protein
MRFNPLAVAVLLCSALIVAITVYAWRHRATNGARPFAIFMASLAVYIFGYSLELASLDLEFALFWNRAEYIGMLSFPSLYLVFVVAYVGRETWLTRRNFLLLAIVPALLLAAKFLDGFLHLFYVTAQLDRSGPFPILAFTAGPLYIIFVAYSLLVVTFANYLLWEKRQSGSILYRRQTTIILLAVLVIYLLYGVYLAQMIFYPGVTRIDFNFLGYTFWGFAVSLTIFHYRLFDLAPVARDTLIEVLHDGVIVVDTQYRVVDANPEAQKIFDWQQSSVGQSVVALLGNWISPTFLESVQDSSRTEISLKKTGQNAFYEVTTSTLKEKHGGRVGYLLVVHDISERIEFEKELEELSLIDELTGLSNRRGFKLLANQLILMADRMSLNAALFYIDLDRLKWINDSLGHAMGDQALVEIASVLKKVFRSSDIVARLGGDEFVVLAVETAENSGPVMQARLHEQISVQNALPDRLYELSFSVGLARYEWHQPVKLDLLLEEADRAMYKEKQEKKQRSGAQRL